jgi:hypothetical protein
MIDLEQYWKDRMSNRMTVRDELTRLEMILKGHYYGANLPIGLKDFFLSKSPYGNKDIEASIAFHLGWDYERTLRHADMPEYVRESARMLHVQLGHELFGDI